MTPSLLQFVVKVPWRYGISTVVKENSWLVFRINAFSPHSAFSGAWEGLVRIGGPVAGFVEPTSGDTESAQLIAWGLCDPAVWKMAAPAAIPCYFELNPNALYRLPQLGAGRFLYVRAPRLISLSWPRRYLFSKALSRPSYPALSPQRFAGGGLLSAVPDAALRHRNSELFQRVPPVPVSSWSQATSAALMVGLGL